MGLLTWPPPRAAFLLLTFVLGVAACGGSDSGGDDDPESQAVAVFEENVEALNDLDAKRYCASLTRAARRSQEVPTAPGDTCVDAYERAFAIVAREKRRNKLEVEVTSVRIDDGVATVIVGRGPGAQSRQLVREDGRWRLATPDEVARRVIAANPPVVDQTDELPAGKRLLVRAVDEELPRRDGHLYELTADGEARRVGKLTCKRVAVSTVGGGICLAATESRVGYQGIVFDEDYEPRARFHVQGVPDRARVSPDGRYGAFTSFDSVGSVGYFASTTGFSTQVDIVDLRTGRRALQEQDLVVTRDGRRFAPKDAEYWGVTFAAGDRFYATLATGDDHYLIEGDVESKRARVVGRDVECPALSPDGRRIAYKRRIGDSNRWRLHVRDLRGGRDIPLAERRSIDDQPEWLGDDTVVYSDDESVFAVSADGAGRPRRLADHATSATALD